jgi:uncharacterized protein
MEIFDYHTEITTHGNGLKPGEFSGMASVVGSLVQAFIPTVIEAGAFKKTLAAHGSKVKILFGHNPERPIGRAIELKEIPRGLFLKGKISDTVEGRDTLTLMRDGALDSMSIGFDPGRYEMRKDETGREVRHLLEIARLWEISVVAFPADPAAVISNVHGVQLFRQSTVDLRAELAQLQRLTSDRQAQNIPTFRGRYGNDWMD